MEKMFRILMFLACLVNQSIVVETESSCLYTPDGCIWLNQEALFCNNLHAQFNKTALENEKNKKCKSSMFMLVFNLIFKHHDSSYILDNTFELYQYIHYFEFLTYYSLSFVGLKGIDARLALNLNNNVDVYYKFYDMEFRFLDDKGQVIRNCNNSDLFSNPNRGNFLSQDAEILSVELYNMKFRDPVCPLLFDDARLENLEISFMVQSIYKNNKIKFMNESTNNGPSKVINSTINRLSFLNFYGLDLDLKLIPSEIFSKTLDFRFVGVINSIQIDFFEWFPQFNSVEFDPIYFRNLVRRQGIEWIQRINRGLVDVDLDNLEDFKANVGYIKQIEFTEIINKHFLSNDKYQFFYDEDLCLIHEFPFRQMIFFNVNSIQVTNYKKRFSCATIWLIRYFPLYVKQSGIKSLKFLSNETLKFLSNRSVIDACSFDSKIKRCKSIYQFKILTKAKKTHEFDFMIISQFLLDIFCPIICFLGILLNFGVVIVVLHNNSRKVMLKKKQYKYMVINSVSNIVVLSIQILSLINECHYPFGMYCSGVRKLVVVQYIKIVAVECIGSFFRLFSNFTYIAFSIARLSLVGENGCLVKFISERAVKLEIFLLVIVCGLLSVVKGFRFKINLASPEENYPFVFYQKRIGFTLSYKSYFSAIFVLDFIYDFINYVLFNFFNLILDCYLLAKIRKVINEKMKKFGLSTESKNNENEKVIDNITWMIVLNAFVNFLCKVPLSIISLNELRLTATSHFNSDLFNTFKNIFNFPYSMQTLCYLDESCLIFYNFCTSLYVITLSVNFFFYLKYDRNFQKSFNSIIGREVSKSN